MSEIITRTWLEGDKLRQDRISPDEFYKPVFIVAVDGFQDTRVVADTAAKARYAVFKMAREAGYFSGRDGFWSFLISSDVWKDRTQ